MDLLGTILTFAKRHAEAVIVVLLGVIAAGSIAGALRIAALSDSISDRDAIQKERAAVNEERLSVMILNARLDREILATRMTMSVAALADASERLVSVTRSHVESDAVLADVVLAPSGHPERLKYVAARLRNTASEISPASEVTHPEVERARATIKSYMTHAAGSQEAYSQQLGRLRPVVRHHSLSRWALFVVGATAVTVMLLLIAAVFRDAKHRAQRVNVPCA